MRIYKMDPSPHVREEFDLLLDCRKPQTSDSDLVLVPCCRKLGTSYSSHLVPTCFPHAHLVLPDIKLPTYNLLSCIS